MAKETVRGLVAFDLDGTLLRGRTTSELIAHGLGRLEQMQRFESFSQEADLIAAREEIARWYAEEPVETLLSYLEKATWAPGAQDAVTRLQAQNIEVVILSITWYTAVGWFASKLGVTTFIGTEHRPGGAIVHVFGRDKARYLRQLVAALGIPPDRVAAVGDSLGDIDMLREAKMRFFVGKEAPPLESLNHLPDANLTMVADSILEAWAV